MISDFCIDRPIFASVIAIIIVLVGLAAMRALPIEQYPNITPPQIQVSAVYPGADAETVANTVASPIEQQVNGVENMIYMYSQNSSSGQMILSVFFDIGSNIEQAQIDVQNQVSLALPQLPKEVQQQGVTVQKQSPSMLMIVAVQSPDGRYDSIYTSNYATINVVDELQRLHGVSNVTIVNARDYAMRIWLRPDLMAQLGITIDDVIDAVKDQNAQFAVGQLGQAPTAAPVQLTLPITAKGRLSEPADFDKIIIRALPDGSMVTIADVGYTELGAQNYDVDGTLNNQSSTLIAVYQMYGANALDVAQEVRQTMDQQAKNFPPGITYSIPYDTTEFIHASIHEVVKTIFEAGFLVVIVVYVFLQSARATLIPLQALIVAIVGTFAGMYLLGLSLNMLTLFGLVLAIGIVVDDAIVVIENVERNMHEFNLSAKEAAHRAMREVTGPVIAIVFVLCSVFIPVAFLGGIAGQLYKQFAITIAIAVVISGVVALTSSPALAALVLKPRGTPIFWQRWFNTGFDHVTQAYLRGTHWLLGHAFIGIAIFTLVCVALITLARIVPTSFVPNEDQGYLIAIASLPDGASLSRTDAVSADIYNATISNPAVQSVISFTGFSFLENINRTNRSSNFIVLKDWSVRKARHLQADSVQKELGAKYYDIPQAQIPIFNPPAIQGLGSVGGFEFWIENRGAGGLSQLEEATNDFIAKAKQRPELSNLMATLETNNQQFYLDLDRAQARAQGVPVASVFRALQAFFGSLYINDFNKFGRVYDVMVQADPAYRSVPTDIDNIFVRSLDSKNMVPLNALASMHPSKGPTLVSRFNGYTAARVNGSAAPGYSSGQALAAVEEVAKEVLNDQMGYDWDGEAYQEKKASGSSASVLAAGIVMVFLILAALYEKWSLPFCILLAVPFGLFGAFLAVWIRGMSNDVYFQIGLVTLIALSAKNAILIIEFAVVKHHEGMNLFDAAMEAAKLRFRAIIMTSLTFVFGVIPLVTSSGAGANSRHSVGTGVLGGMLAATFLAIFFVPLFFRLIEGFSERRRPLLPKAQVAETAEVGHV